MLTRNFNYNQRRRSPLLDKERQEANDCSARVLCSPVVISPPLIRPRMNLEWYLYVHLCNWLSFDEPILSHITSNSLPPSIEARLFILHNKGAQLIHKTIMNLNWPMQFHYSHCIILQTQLQPSPLRTVNNLISIKPPQFIFIYRTSNPRTVSLLPYRHTLPPRCPPWWFPYGGYSSHNSQPTSGYLPKWTPTPWLGTGTLRCQSYIVGHPRRSSNANISNSIHFLTLPHFLQQRMHTVHW